jgi:hypothetical protein
LRTTELIGLGGVLLMGCVGCERNLDGQRIGGTLSLAIAWLSYADDGTLIAASRDRVVRLDPMLGEIDRTIPPFPFDPTFEQPGLEYFSASRDGSVAAFGWQDNTLPPTPPTLMAGGVVFGLGSGALLRLDSYADDTDHPQELFQGLFLSPDGKTMAFVAAETGVETVAPRMALWQAPRSWNSPVFTGDSTALVIPASATEIDVRNTIDGSLRFTIAPPSTDQNLPIAAVSADSTTLAVYSMTLTGNTQIPVITTWRLADGSPELTLSIPADLGATYPIALVVSPDGSQIAASFVPAAGNTLLVWSGAELAYRRDGDTDDALAFSPDGATLATDSRTLGVRLLSARDGSVLAGRLVPATP